jgi:hypothetical protein
MANVKLVRKRATYLTFKYMLEQIRTNERAALEAYHNEIDCRHGYKSATNAAYARESLEQVFADMGVK